jgi:hypothetical protein
MAAPYQDQAIAACGLRERKYLADTLHACTSPSHRVVRCSCSKRPNNRPAISADTAGLEADPPWQWAESTIPPLVQRNA